MTTQICSGIPKHFEIPLEFSEFADEPVAKSSRAKPLCFSIQTPRGAATGNEMKQSRFSNRLGIKPSIRLSDYRAKAVIDWVQLEVVLNVKTQSRWLSVKLGEVLGKNPRVAEKGVPYSRNGNPYYSGREFWVKVEDPTPKRLEILRSYLAERFDSFEATKVVGIELSLDFYPRDHSDQKRWEMVSALRLLHCPKYFKMKSMKDNLRQVVAADPLGKETMTRHILPKIGGANRFDYFGDQDAEDEKVQKRIMDHSLHKIPYVDSITYLGRKGGEVKYRYQNKTADNRSRSEERKEILGQDEKRARLEVTLLGGELNRIGLNSVSDLSEFGFAKLGSAYFRFSLPLIQTDAKDDGIEREPKLLKAGVRAARGRFAKEVFSKSGMYGFQLQQAVIRERRKKTRRLRLKLDGGGLSPMPRKVSSQNSQQWSEMNAAVYQAFSGLENRWGS